MGTIGEYVKTKAAQAEADSHFRKTLNFWLRERNNKLVKFERGKRGTLDYGKYVIMIISKPNPDMVRLGIKAPQMITILWGDYGILTYATTKGYERRLKWKFYKQKSAAENEYKKQVRMMNI